MSMIDTRGMAKVKGPAAEKAEPRKTPLWVWIPFVLAPVFGIGAALGGLAWFEFTPAEKTCATCHEIRGAARSWAHGAHAGTDCKACHGGSCETLAALGDNMRRMWKHVTGEKPEKLGKTFALSEAQVARMSEACGKCHAGEYAQWKRSGHASGAEKYLTNAVHNAAWKPDAQCFRCHGMFMEGDMEDILERVPNTGRFTVVNTAGDLPRKWRFRDAGREGMAAVPCLACHSGHGKAEDGPLAFYVRAQQVHMRPGRLHMQRIEKDGKEVGTSPDPAAKLCQQCHAANAEGEAGSSDDKTPTGAHEGISCVKCHRGHDFDPKRSCGTCHEKCVLKVGEKFKH